MRLHEYNYRLEVETEGNKIALIFLVKILTKGSVNIAITTLEKSINKNTHKDSSPEEIRPPILLMTK